MNTAAKIRDERPAKSARPGQVKTNQLQHAAAPEQHDMPFAQHFTHVAPVQLELQQLIPQQSLDAALTDGGPADTDITENAKTANNFNIKILFV